MKTMRKHVTCFSTSYLFHPWVKSSPQLCRAYIPWRISWIAFFKPGQMKKRSWTMAVFRFVFSFVFSNSSFDAFYSVWKMCTFRCKTSDVCVYVYIYIYSLYIHRITIIISIINIHITYDNHTCDVLKTMTSPKICDVFTYLWGFLAQEIFADQGRQRCLPQELWNVRQRLAETPGACGLPTAGGLAVSHL